MDVNDPEFREKLSAFQDGELTGEDAAEVLKVLAVDPAAQKLLSQYERVSALARQAMCPTDADLSKAVGNVDSELVPLWIKRHLEQCPRCQSIVTKTGDLISDLVPSTLDKATEKKTVASFSNLAALDQPSTPTGFPQYQPPASSGTVAPTQPPQSESQTEKTQESVPAIMRFCVNCGNSVHLPVKFAGIPIMCPQCGEAIPPSPDEPVLDELNKEEAVRSATSWSMSLALHVILLFVFISITWQAGRPAGSGEGEVGIVFDNSGEIQSEQTTIQKMNTATQVKSVESSQLAEQKINETESNRDNAAEQLIGVDLSSGADAAIISNDFSSFSDAGGGLFGEGGTSFFGLLAKGGKFVYVVDRSGSMIKDGPRLPAAKAELIRSVNSLDRKKQFYVVFYNRQALSMPPGKRLVKADSKGKRAALTWINSVTADGGTDPTQALLIALSMQPDAIWLLSDGQFAMSAADTIRKANPGKKTQIHTIAFHNSEGERVLKRIAYENRGKFRFVPGQ